MNLDKLQMFFATSPAAKLLRSPHAAHIIYFLFREFKESRPITAPHTLLSQRLSEFLESIHETDPDILRDRPEIYLAAWSTGDCRWLRRFWDSENSEASYELTPHTEDVLTFLGDALNRSLGFVGTESRLKRIIETLTDIVVRGSSDPSRRLEHLRAERDRLDREISAIESGAAVSSYGPTAIRERFADASELTSLQVVGGASLRFTVSEASIPEDRRSRILQPQSAAPSEQRPPRLRGMKYTSTSLITRLPLNSPSGVCVRYAR